jgi:hypothetical protein
MPLTFKNADDYDKLNGGDTLSLSNVFAGMDKGEITLKNENMVSRNPIPVQLNKGWNKVFIKLPVGTFNTHQVRLVKWMFAFVLTTLDGRDAIEALIYSPDRRIIP